MKISTFQARDMREALKEVKEKLGADAVILSTRSLRASGSGLALGRTLIEVTACPGPNARNRPEAEEQAPPPPPAPPIGQPAQPVPGRFSRIVDDAVDYPEPPRSPPPHRNKPDPVVPSPEPLARNESLIAHTTETPTEPYGLRTSPLSDTTLEGGLTHEMPTRSTFDQPGELTGLDAESKRNYSWLLMHGVEEPIARRIVLMDRSGKERGLAVAFQRALKFRDPLAGPARVVALVGPTGVGKTTTLAKIAADLILNRQRSVGMITLDTFRVGAVAQLETYAKLLQVRLVVARAPSEVKAGLHSLNRCDYVLVDTVGSSPYNRRQVNSTATLLPDIGDEREVILCMAANVRETEQQAIYRRFSVLKPTGLIFTKLDETVTYGGILNVCIKANLPLTMYTDGQRVPENLGWMSAKTLSKWFARDTQADL